MYWCFRLYCCCFSIFLIFVVFVDVSVLVNQWRCCSKHLFDGLWVAPWYLIQCGGDLSKRAVDTLFFIADFDKFQAEFSGELWWPSNVVVVIFVVASTYIYFYFQKDQTSKERMLQSLSSMSSSQIVSATTLQDTTNIDPCIYHKNTNNSNRFYYTNNNCRQYTKNTNSITNNNLKNNNVNNAITNNTNNSNNNNSFYEVVTNCYDDEATAYEVYSIFINKSYMYIKYYICMYKRMRKECFRSLIFKSFFVTIFAVSFPTT